MNRRKPLTPEQRIQVAKDSIDNGGPADYAIAHTLIALTETLRELFEPDVAEAPEPIVTWQGGTA